jgi:hypothetical protein
MPVKISFIIGCFVCVEVIIGREVEVDVSVCAVVGETVLVGVWVPTSSTVGIEMSLFPNSMLSEILGFCAQLVKQHTVSRKKRR